MAITLTASDQHAKTEAGMFQEVADRLDMNEARLKNMRPHRNNDWQELDQFDKLKVLVLLVQLLADASRRGTDLRATCWAKRNE